MKRATESLCVRLLILFVLTFLATPLAGADKDEGSASPEEWGQWVGKKVDVDYRACEPTGCVLVRGAPLKEVTDEAIVVVVNGSPFLIPRYMVKSVQLSKQRCPIP
jgi:hypothetical protein